MIGRRKKGRERKTDRRICLECKQIPWDKVVRRGREGRMREKDNGEVWNRKEREGKRKINICDIEIK